MGDVRDSYSRWADEYVRLLGSMTSVHGSDRQLVTDWATQIDGPVIDVGSGPGQWTDHLASLGCDVRGVEPTPEFVEHAREAYPSRRFDVGSAEALSEPSGSVAGILAWYSLIHHRPGDIDVALAEFARALRPGGGLLIGFFTGPSVEPFDHTVATAYRWPAQDMSARLEAAGIRTVETHTRTGHGHRPHAAIVAASAREV